MAIITLLTDFGYRDGYPGVMKGVIWKIAPHVKIVDLSHDIAPQDVLEAALLLWRTDPYFPDSTIHLAVVDPGVGTSRRGILAKIGSHYFVGPDNGLITLLLVAAAENNENTTFIHLDRPEYWLPEVSYSFHGRDVFAPVAAYLANGIHLVDLGTPITNPVTLSIPLPVQIPSGWQGQVLHIDHFGNLSTNLRSKHIYKAKDMMIRINGEQIGGLVSTFGERPIGSLIALMDSSGSLAISVVNGSAVQVLQAKVGDYVEVLYS